MQELEHGLVTTGSVPPLPPWSPKMFDGCSAMPVGPLAFRRRFNHWFFKKWPGATPGCEPHDEDHYYGGSKEDRLKSDHRFMARWEVAGVPRWLRRLTFRLVRAFGGPRWRIPGVSWAHGGGRFKYTEHPAFPSP